MALLANRKFYLILLAAFCVTFVKSLSKIDKESKAEDVDEMFNKIEEINHKLKRVFQDILAEALEDKEQETHTTEETSNDDVVVRQRTNFKEKCRCLPYHLCYPETGEQVSDGRFLLAPRVNSYECEDHNDVCCTQISPSSPRMAITSHSKCGYGYWTKATQQFPIDDDPAVPKFGQFPWTVMIMISKNKQYTCAGSLIHPKVVLTAAHCVNTTDDLVTVRAGEWNISTKSEPFGHQNRNVRQIIKHPKFLRDNLVYDVALLITEEEFELQPNINTVCLTKSAPKPLITHPDQCVATGWGIDKPNGRYSRIMNKLKFSLVDYKQCQQAFRSTHLGNKFELHQTFICAKGQDGSDACEGNGGAPLICSTKQPNRYQQVGLVSWGIGCAEGFPTVFTKISQIKDWIDNEFDTLKYDKDYYTM